MRRYFLEQGPFVCYTTGAILPSRRGGRRARDPASGVELMAETRSMPISPTSWAVRVEPSWYLSIYAVFLSGLFLALVFFATAVHVHLIAPFLLIVMYALVAYQFPQAGFALLITFMIYQNIVISFVSSEIRTPQVLQVLQGTNFAFICCAAGVAALRMISMRLPAGDSSRLVFRFALVVLALLVLYSAYGALGSSMLSALIYFRLYANPILLLIVGVYMGMILDARRAMIVFLVIASPAMAIGILEIAAPKWFYQLISAEHFYNLKFHEHGREFSVYSLAAGQARRFLNLPLAVDFSSIRFGGTNMHPVSFGYVLAIITLFAAATRRYFHMVLSLPLLFVIGTKGAMILTVMTFVLYAIATTIRKPAAILTICGGFAVFYVVAGISYGYAIGDWHIIGLIGGFTNSLKYPIGYGIGVGGNLSDLSWAGIDWTEATQYGVAYAVESAIGVLVYQMGVAGLVVIGLLFVVIRRGLATVDWTVSGRTTAMFVFAFLVTSVNGIFQEEAFSPYALGLLACYAGIMLGNATAARQFATSAAGP